MNKKIALFSCLLGVFFAFNSFADKYVVVNTNTGAKIPVTGDTNGAKNVFSANIQSTSVDWEAISGLPLHEYRISFDGKKAAGNIGWEMYYMDGFPCYGYAQYVRAWVNSMDSQGEIRLNCLRRPENITLSYRIAKKDESQNRTTGILKCKVEKNLSVGLDKCEKVNWNDFAKDK
jgi:hypothetical protein